MHVTTIDQPYVCDVTGCRQADWIRSLPNRANQPQKLGMIRLSARATVSPKTIPAHAMLNRCGNWKDFKSNATGMVPTFDSYQPPKRALGSSSPSPALVKQRDMQLCSWDTNRYKGVIVVAFARLGRPCRWYISVAWQKPCKP